MPSFEGNLLTQRQQITSLETRDSRLSYGENQESLSHLGLVRHRIVTDRRTDGIAIANTRRSSTGLPVQLWRVKNDLYDASLHHLVYQIMNLWLVLLA